MSIEVPFIILTIFIVLYILVFWLLKKRNIGSRMNRKYLALIPSIVLAPLIYIVIIIVWIYSASNYPAIDFNKALWGSNIEERYTMSEHIIQSQMLIGLTKEEVIEILGDDFTVNGPNSISFFLGYAPRIVGIDPDVLVIYFEDNKVVKVEQRNS